MNDWIHTRRGVTLVEGTLPRLARALEALTVEVKRMNDRAEQAEQVKQLTFEEGCNCHSCSLRRKMESWEGEE